MSALGTVLVYEFTSTFSCLLTVSERLVQGFNFLEPGIIDLAVSAIIRVGFDFVAWALTEKPSKTEQKPAYMQDKDTKNTVKSTTKN